MTQNSKNLCLLILKENFGEIIEKIVSYLINEDFATLPLIVKNTKEKLSNVKKSLKVLLIHNLISVNLNAFNIAEYKINIDQILLITRYQKFIYIAKVLFGDLGENIIEEIIREGQLTASDTIQRVINRLIASSAISDEPQNILRTLYDNFNELIRTGFLIKKANVSKRSWTEQNAIRNEDSFIDHSGDTSLPQVKLNLIKINQNNDESNDNQPSAKRMRIENEKQPDDGVYWTINADRFNKYLCDLVIVEGIKNNYDDSKAANIAKIILNISEMKKSFTGQTISPLISKQSIIEKALKEPEFTSKDEVEQYLSMLNDDKNARFIERKEQSASGGMYAVNIGIVIDKLINSCLCSIVEDRFGSKAARIFRSILTRKYLQQKQIEEIAMIPSKDCKELTYILFKESFIKTLQYPRQPDYAPSKTFFVFTVDKINLSKRLIDHCYKAHYNAMQRRIVDHSKHKSLLERKTFIDMIISNLEQQRNLVDEIELNQQIDDLRKSFSTYETELIEKIEHSEKKLELSENQLDETVFLLQLFLSMHKIRF